MKIGDKLPEFNLKGFDDQFHSNYEYAEKYALAIIFTCNSSVQSKAYSERFVKLFERYEEDNFGIIGINSNDDKQVPEETMEMMKLAAFHFKLHTLHFMYLKDEDQSVAKKFGAKVNPEVFLFNSKRELVYRGAIDDSWENEHMVTSAYLEDAIESALDGIEVDYPEIEPVGTPIVWKK